MVLQPFPRSPACRLNSGMDFHAPRPSHCGDIFTGSICGAKLAHLIFGELHLSVFFAAICSTVLDAIHAVVGACRPSQVFFIDAFAVTAVMRRISKLGRARSVSDFTNQAGYSDPSTFSGVVWISVPVDRKRPFDAIFGAYLKGIKDEIIGFRHSLKLADFRR